MSVFIHKINFIGFLHVHPPSRSSACCDISGPEMNKITFKSQNIETLRILLPLPPLSVCPDI